MSVKRDDAIPAGCFFPLALVAPFVAYGVYQNVPIGPALFLAGVILMIVSMLAYSVVKRLTRLEKRIDEFEQQDDAADRESSQPPDHSAAR
jgi:hypothetical protein